MESEERKKGNNVLEPARLKGADLSVTQMFPSLKDILKLLLLHTQIHKHKANTYAHM